MTTRKTKQEKKENMQVGNNTRTNKTLLGIAGTVILILVAIIGFLLKPLVSDVREMKQQSVVNVQTSKDVKDIKGMLPDIDKRIISNTNAIKTLAIAFGSEELEKIINSIVKAAQLSIEKHLKEMRDTIAGNIASVGDMGMVSQIISESNLSLNKNLEQLNVSLGRFEKDFKQLHEETQKSNQGINNLSKFLYAGQIIPLIDWEKGMPMFGTGAEFQTIYGPKFTVKNGIVWKAVAKDYVKGLEGVGLGIPTPESHRPGAYGEVWGW